MQSKAKLDEINLEHGEEDKNVRDDDDENDKEEVSSKKTTSKVFNSFSSPNEYDSFTTTIQTTEKEKPRSFIESILGTESTSSASSLFNQSNNSLFAIRLFLTLLTILFRLR